MPKKKDPPFHVDTRELILNTATELFALKGYKAVTLREVCRVVGITIPTIYYYFEDKDTLFEAVLGRFEEVYRGYHDWLHKMNEKAETLDEVLENLLGGKYFEDLDSVARLGVAMVLKEQHHHESVRKIVFEHMYESGVENIKAGFDRLVGKKVIPPSDTKMMAVICMLCIISGNDIYIHEFSGTETAIEIPKVTAGLKKLVTAALNQAILPVN